MAEIILYQLPGCPYCAKVRAELSKREMDYLVVNVAKNRSDKLRMELFVNSGVPTVPVIKIDDLWVGDSENIITYLEEHF